MRSFKTPPWGSGSPAIFIIGRVLDVEVVAVGDSESLTRQSKEEDRRSLAGYRTAGGGKRRRKSFFISYFLVSRKGSREPGTCTCTLLSSRAMCGAQ